MPQRDPLNDWLVKWVDREYPSAATFSRPDARLRAFKAMPHGHVPSIDKLVWGWFVKRFNDILDGADFAFPDGRAGKTIARQEMLPWDQESKILVDQLRLAKTDIAAVKERLARWAAAKEPSMDVDAKMGELLRAAGL
jgi:hypothetical protein